jgi:hypothetical protein
LEPKELSYGTSNIERFLKKSKKATEKSKKKSNKKSKAPKQISCTCVNDLATFEEQVTAGYPLVEVKTITLCPGKILDIPNQIIVPYESLPIVGSGSFCTTYSLKIKRGCLNARNCGLRYTGKSLNISEAPINFIEAGDMVSVSIIVEGITLSSSLPSPSFFQVTDQHVSGCFNRCTTNMSPNTSADVGMLCSAW